MKTKPKPTSFLGNRAKKYPTYTITGTPDPAKLVSLKGKPARDTLSDDLDKYTTPRPKTAPKHPKRVKTRATPSHPIKTGWIAFEDKRPPEFTSLIYGRWKLTAKNKLPFWVRAVTPCPHFTHWLVLPPPPERKCK